MSAAPYASAASLATAQDPSFGRVGAIEESASPLRAFFRRDRGFQRPTRRIERGGDRIERLRTSGSGRSAFQARNASLSQRRFLRELRLRETTMFAPRAHGIYPLRDPAFDIEGDAPLLRERGKARFCRNTIRGVFGCRDHAIEPFAGKDGHFGAVRSEKELGFGGHFSIFQSINHFGATAGRSIVDRPARRDGEDGENPAILRENHAPVTHPQAKRIRSFQSGDIIGEFATRGCQLRDLRPNARSFIGRHPAKGFGGGLGENDFHSPYITDNNVYTTTKNNKQAFLLSRIAKSGIAAIAPGVAR